MGGTRNIAELGITVTEIGSRDPWWTSAWEFVTHHHTKASPLVMTCSYALTVCLYVSCLHHTRCFFSPSNLNVFSNSKLQFPLTVSLLIDHLDSYFGYLWEAILQLSFVNFPFSLPDQLVQPVALSNCDSKEWHGFLDLPLQQGLWMGQLSIERAICMACIKMNKSRKTAIPKNTAIFLICL